MTIDLKIDSIEALSLSLSSTLLTAFLLIKSVKSISQVFYINFIYNI